MDNLEMALLSWLHSKQNVWSATSIRSYRSKLRTLIRMDFRPAYCLDRMFKENYSHYTIKNYFTCAASFESEALGTSEFRDFLKANKSLFKNAYKEKTKAIPSEVVKNALESCSSTGMFNFIILCSSCGLRKSEALKAKWDDITSEGWLQVPMGKGRKWRKVPINKKLLKPSSGELIAGPKLNLPLFKTLLPGYSPHDLRAYYITRLANEHGLNIKDVAWLAGHSSISTTQRYIRVNEDKIKDKVKSIIF